MFKISQKLNFKLLWAANETKNRVEQIEKNRRTWVLLWLIQRNNMPQSKPSDSNGIEILD